MYFLLVVRYLRRENLHNGRALSVRGFSTFGADIFRGGGQHVFGQFVFDVTSVICDTIVH